MSFQRMRGTPADKDRELCAAIGNNIEGEYRYPLLIGSAPIKQPTLLNAVEYLLDEGADPRAIHQGKTVLLLAAEKANPAIVKLLLAKGADARAVTKYGKTALMAAAENNDVESAEALLAKDALVDAVMLRSEGAKHGQKTNEGKTPLIFAAIHGSTDVIRILLDHGADISAKTPDGKNAIAHAEEAHHPEAAALLRKHRDSINSIKDIENAGQYGDGDTDLMLAARDGMQNIVRAILEKGDSKVNARTTGKSNYLTALMFAVRQGHTEIAEMLLNASADVNAADRDGVTPLMSAVKRGDEKTVTLLLRRGADQTAATHGGITASDLAESIKDDSICSKMKELLANPPAQDKLAVDDERTRVVR